MKYLIPIFLLIPFALNAMNRTSSSEKHKPIEAFIIPVFRHARADHQGHGTIAFGYCKYHDNRACSDDEMIINDNDCPDKEKTTLATNSGNPIIGFEAFLKKNTDNWRRLKRRHIGYAVGGKELIIQETIPNDETKQFTVLFSLKNDPSDSWHQGAVIEKYDRENIPLGDATNGVQYLLNIPASNAGHINLDGSIHRADSSEKADLSDDAKKLLAIIDECNQRSVSKTVIAKLNLGLLIFVLGVLATSSQSSSN